jgi:hypothetical protein
VKWKTGQFSDWDYMVAAARAALLIAKGSARDQMTDDDVPLDIAWPPLLDGPGAGSAA